MHVLVLFRFYKALRRMTNLIIFLSLWTVGFFLCRSMLRIEHEAENNDYTKGDRVINNGLSLLSFLMVMIILVRAWIRQVGSKGYWAQPVKPVKQKTE